MLAVVDLFKNSSEAGQLTLRRVDLKNCLAPQTDRLGYLFRCILSEQLEFCKEHRATMFLLGDAPAIDDSRPPLLLPRMQCAKTPSWMVVPSADEKK